MISLADNEVTKKLAAWAAIIAVPTMHVPKVRSSGDSGTNMRDSKVKNTANRLFQMKV